MRSPVRVGRKIVWENRWVNVRMYVHTHASGEYKELNRDRGCCWCAGWLGSPVEALVRGPDSLQIKPHSLSLFETLSKRRLFNRAEKLDNV